MKVQNTGIGQETFLIVEALLCGHHVELLDMGLIIIHNQWKVSLPMCQDLRYHVFDL